jgi:hypothetical protein
MTRRPKRASCRRMRVKDKVHEVIFIFVGRVDSLLQQANPDVFSNDTVESDLNLFQPCGNRTCRQRRFGHLPTFLLVLSKLGARPKSSISAGKWNGCSLESGKGRVAKLIECECCSSRKATELPKKKIDVIYKYSGKALGNCGYVLVRFDVWLFGRRCL